MDIRAGRGTWQHLNPTAAQLWHRLTAGIPPNQAADEVTDHFVDQGVDRERVRTDLDALIRQLRDAGLLTAASAPALPAAPLTVHMALPTTTSLPLADRIAGALGATAALLLLRCTPIRASIALARLTSRMPAPAATVEHAEVLFAAVRRASRWYPGCAAATSPGRSACAPPRPRLTPGPRPAVRSLARTPPTASGPTPPLCESPPARRFATLIARDTHTGESLAEV
nr:PqqD family protein [Streptomyces sp. MNP-20]